MCMLFGDFMAQTMFWLIVVIVVIMNICKKIAGSDSEVATAAKHAATKKAISLIGRFLR